MVALTLEYMILLPKRVLFHTTHAYRTWRAARNRRKAFASISILRATPKTPARPAIRLLEWAESVPKLTSIPMPLLASTELTVSCRLLLTLPTVSRLRFMPVGPLRTYRFIILHYVAVLCYSILADLLTYSFVLFCDTERASMPSPWSSTKEALSVTPRFGT
jgi:hypothetical protein